MKNFDFFNQFLYFTKEWASLLLAFIGILISWKTSKLSSKNSDRKRIAMLINQEMENEREIKKRFLENYNFLFLKLENYLNETSKIVKMISDKEVDLYNEFSPSHSLSVIELHKVINLYFIKKIGDVQEKYGQIESLISLTISENSDNKEIFFQCTSCGVIYWKQDCYFLIDSIFVTQEKLRTNKRNYNQYTHVTKLDFDRDFAPYIALLNNLAKFLSTNLERVSFFGNNTLRINLSFCQNCQKTEALTWWSFYYPNVKFETFTKLINRVSEVL